MTNRDAYIRDVIAQGDTGSKLLHARTVQTLEWRDEVSIVGGNAVLRIPEDQIVMVHSIAADPQLLDPRRHAASLVSRLVDK